MVNTQRLTFREVVEFFKIVKESGHELEIPESVFKQLVCKHFDVVDSGSISRLVNSFLDLGLIKDTSDAFTKYKVYQLQYVGLLKSDEKSKAANASDQHELENSMPERV